MDPEGVSITPKWIVRETQSDKEVWGNTEIFGDDVLIGGRDAEPFLMNKIGWLEEHYLMKWGYLDENVKREMEEMTKTSGVKAALVKGGVVE